jgi:ABC-type uncharacterized transport system fused permease/ATPase subunit
VILLSVVLPRSFLNQTLQLRWRRWLTNQYLAHWLAERIFYRLRFSGKTDNPDQRISEDVRIFTEKTVFLAFGLLSSLVTLASFAAILWHLSGSITVPIDGFEITIPGYMFWVAVLYSGGGSVLAHLVGRPLIRLSNRQQSVDADFRFSLVRLREEDESIALYGGEAQERGSVFANWRAAVDRLTELGGEIKREANAEVVGARIETTARDTIELKRERMDEEAHWTHVLSPGEQQRVAIARALLNKPDWLFLDEATSALEEDQEGALYRRLADALARTTMISIGHRRSLEAYHQRVIMVERKPGHPWLIRAEPPIVS